MELYKHQIDEYKRQLMDKPTDAYVHYNLAHYYNSLYKETGNEETSKLCLTHYRTAIELKPNFFEALTNLGIVMISLVPSDIEKYSVDYLDECITYFKKAIDIGKVGSEGILPYIYCGQANYFKGIKLGNADHFEVAAYYFNIAEIRGYDDKNYWIAYAETLVELSLLTLNMVKFDEAFDKYQKAVNLGYNITEVYSRRIVDGYRMIGKGSGNSEIVIQIIDKMVEITLVALDLKLQFNTIQKQAIEKISKNVVTYGQTAHTQFGSSVPELLIPFFVMVHNQKELLYENAS
jgi:tetratricopeptide (TPR) repeat protein